MSIFGILFNYVNFSKRVKEDKRGHFDVLHPSVRFPRMWRGFDQRHE